MSLLQPFPVQHTPDRGWRVTLGDLYASAPLALGLLLHVEDVATLGPAHLVDLVIRSDAVTERGIEQRTETVPVEANLDGRDHPEPAVERTFLHFEARAPGRPRSAGPTRATSTAPRAPFARPRASWSRWRRAMRRWQR